MIKNILIGLCRLSLPLVGIVGDKIIFLPDMQALRRRMLWTMPLSPPPSWCCSGKSLFSSEVDQRIRYFINLYGFMASISQANKNSLCLFAPPFPRPQTENRKRIFPLIGTI